MADFFESLVAANILTPDHGFTDPAEVTEVLVNHLKSEKALKDEVKELKLAQGTPSPEPADPPSAPAAAANPVADAPPTAAPSPTPPGAAVDTSVLTTAKWLHETGQIKFDGTTYEAVEAGYAPQAAALNADHMDRARKRSQTMDSFVKSPGEFAREHMSEMIQEMVSKGVEEATAPLQAQIAEYESKFVPLPSEQEQYIFSHEDEWNAPDSKRKAIYDETVQTLTDQFKEQNLLQDATEDEFKRQVHQMAATKTDLMMLVDRPPATDPPADPAPAQTAPPEPVSFIDNVNAGEQPNESGTRNNGTARQLNEHAQQVGDTSQPMTAQGRVDFQKLASQSAQNLGINL